jgi:hypothetical protein
MFFVTSCSNSVVLTENSKFIYFIGLDAPNAFLGILLQNTKRINKKMVQK